MQSSRQWLFHGPLTGVLVWVGAMLILLGVVTLLTVAIMMIGRGMVAILR